MARRARGQARVDSGRGWAQALGLESRLKRLRSGSRGVVQAALAAGVAWFVATVVLGYDRPFFAPVAAIIALGTTTGQRGHRAVELVVGVAVGIAVADLIVLAIGAGTVQLVVVTALTTAAALLLGGSPVLFNQAAVSAILVVTLHPPTEGLVLDRFFHALLGGGVALLFSQVLFPIDPLTTAIQASHPVFRGLADALEKTANALRLGDRDLARRALLDARALDAQVRGLQDALAVGHETARLAPVRRGARGQLEVYSEATSEVDLAVRNTRVLARAAVYLLRVRRGQPAPAGLAEAVEALAEAVRALGRQWEDPGQGAQARRLALTAVTRASHLLDEHVADLAPIMVVGQIRSTAIDLLRGSGMELTAAQDAVDAATITEPGL
jgi:uncharacterized membrane protein YgaE (UPF0421/DUF939 family)